MTQTILDKLQALVKDIKFIRDMNVMLDRRRILMELESILATEPPAVTVRAGWVCKDRDGMWFCEHKPELRVDGKWTTPGSLYLSKRVFTDPWPDKPNGGPECCMEVR